MLKVAIAGPGNKLPKQPPDWVQLEGQTYQWARAEHEGCVLYEMPHKRQRIAIDHNNRVICQMVHVDTTTGCCRELSSIVGLIRARPVPAPPAA